MRPRISTSNTQKNKNVAVPPHVTRPSLLASFFRKNRGAVGIEFAFVMPLFLLVIITMLETALQFLASLLLHTGLDAASRAIMLGKIRGSESTVVKRIKDVIKKEIGFMAGAEDNIYILLKKSTNFQKISFKPPTNEKGDFDPKQLNKADKWDEKEIVFLTLYYKFPISTGVLDFFRTRERKNYSVITATKIIKIEPL